MYSEGQQHRHITEKDTDLPHEAVVVTELDLGDADKSARVRTVPRTTRQPLSRGTAHAVVPQSGERCSTDLQPFTPSSPVM